MNHYTVQLFDISHYCMTLFSTLTSRWMTVYDYVM